MLLRAYVLGSGVTKVDRHYEKSYLDLVDEAVAKATADVGLNLFDVEYLIVSSALPELTINQADPSTTIAQNLGLSKVKTLTVSTGEVSGAAAVDYALTLVKSGRARRVLVVGFEKMSEYPSWIINNAYSKILEYEVEGTRNVSPPDYAALIMKEYMRRYGVSREEIVKWSIKMHENAVRNPNAQLPFTITLDSLSKALRVSEPVTILDSHPIGDGAAALFVTNDESIGRTGSTPVELVDVEAAVNAPPYLRDDVTYFTATATAYEKLSKRHNLKIDHNVALNVYDTYTIYGFLTIEALGLSERGRSPEVIGKMPYLNVGGGLKARGHPIGATPLYQIHEVCELFNGRSWVKYDGDIALVHSMSGPDNSSWLILLRGWG
ncbi:MAG: thiolase family protein [Zestosphaera sp.]